MNGDFDGRNFMIICNEKTNYINKKHTFETHLSLTAQNLKASKNQYFSMYLFKGKGHPMTCLCRHRGQGWGGCSSNPFATSAIEEGGDVSITHRSLYPQKYPLSIVQETGPVRMGREKTRPHRDPIPGSSNP